MRTAKVYLDDGTSYETSINGTDAEIRAYFVGQTLNFGVEGDDLFGVEGDDLKKCVDVEIRD